MIVSCIPLLLNYKYCPCMCMWIQMLLSKKILLFTCRDNTVTTENQLAPNWIPCSSAGTGGEGIPEVCTAALAEDRCTFHKQRYFVENAESKSTEGTWHVLPAMTLISLIRKSDVLIDLYSNIDSILTYPSLFHPINWKDWTRVNTTCNIKVYWCLLNTVYILTSFTIKMLSPPLFS